MVLSPPTSTAHNVKQDCCQLLCDMLRHSHILAVYRCCRDARSFQRNSRTSAAVPAKPPATVRLAPATAQHPNTAAAASTQASGVLLLPAIRRAGLPAAISGKIVAAIAGRATPHGGPPATAARGCRAEPAAVVDGAEASSVGGRSRSVAAHVGYPVPVLSTVRTAKGGTGRRFVLLRLEAVCRRVLRRSRLRQCFIWSTCPKLKLWASVCGLQQQQS